MNKDSKSTEGQVGDKYFDVWKSKYERVEEYTAQNNLKYTKGNWRSGRNLVFVANSKDPICYVTKSEDTQEGKANLKLISQAPNMIMTLYLCEEYFTDLRRQQWGLRPYESEVLKIIKTAIKKATK